MPSTTQAEFVETTSPVWGRDYCPECGESLGWFKSIYTGKYKVACPYCGFNETIT